MVKPGRIELKRDPRHLDIPDLRRQRALRERLNERALSQTGQRQELERASDKLRRDRREALEALRLYDHAPASFRSAYEDTKSKDPRLDPFSFFRSVNSGLSALSRFDPRLDPLGIYQNHNASRLSEELRNRALLADLLSSRDGIRLLYRLGKMDLREGRHIAFLLKFISLILSSILSNIGSRKDLLLVTQSLFERDRFEYLKRGFQYISEFFRKQIEKEAEEKGTSRIREKAKTEETSGKKEDKKKKEVRLAIDSAKSTLEIDPAKPEELKLKESGTPEDRLKLLEIIIEIGRLTKPLRAVETRTEKEAAIRGEAEKLVWECGLKERGLFSKLIDHAETLKAVREKVSKEEGRPVRLSDFLRRIERGLSEMMRKNSAEKAVQDLASLSGLDPKTSANLLSLAYEWGKYSEKIQTHPQNTLPSGSRHAIAAELFRRLPAPDPSNSAFISSMLKVLEAPANLEALVLGCQLLLTAPSDFSSLKYEAAETSPEPGTIYNSISSLINAGKTWSKLEYEVKQALEARDINTLTRIMIRITTPDIYPISPAALPQGVRIKLLEMLLPGSGPGAVKILLAVHHGIEQLPLAAGIKNRINTILEKTVRSIANDPDNSIATAFLNSLLHRTYGAKGWFGHGKNIDREQLRLELEFLGQRPRILPQLLTAYAKNHSFIKNLIAKLWKRLGFETGNSDRIIEDLIEKLTRTSEGQYEAVKYLTASPSASLPRHLLIKIIRNILAAKASENSGTKLASALIGLAAENGSVTTENLLSRTALRKAILNIAVELVRFGELAETGELPGAAEKLVSIIKTADRSGIKLPLMPFSPLAVIIQYVSQMSKYDLPHILEKLESLRENQEIWENLVKALGQDPGFGLYALKYAYCFLSERGFVPKREGEELKSLLASENGRAQLFLTLQKIPTVIKEHLLNNYGEAFKQVGKDELFVELLVFWNLLGTKNLDERLDRRQIAGNILNFIRNDWDKGELWNGLVKLAEENRFDLLNRFFHSLVDKIMEFGKGMDMEKISTQENMVSIGRNPFKKDILPYQLGMALRSTETIILDAAQGAPRGF